MSSARAHGWGTGGATCHGLASQWAGETVPVATGPPGKPLGALMSDVFISYSRRDIAFARLIREALQQSQIDTWIDWDRIPVGERWWQEIAEAIEGANVFMLIISRNSLSSKVCRDEIEPVSYTH